MASGARRVIVTVLLVGLVVAGALTGDPPRAVSAAPGAPHQDPDRLDRARRGRDAIAALGTRLPAVAARHSITAPRLRERLERDPSLWVDETLQLYFVDPIEDHHDHHDHAGTFGMAEPSSDHGEPAAAPGDVFALHSLPGAERVLYLDFDGHTTTGTGWNNNPQLGTGSTVVSTPYDSDGDPGSFSAAEQAVVYDVWQRVAEDFAPFAVNVTTADPGTAAIDRSSSLDEEFGTRVVIAGSSPIAQSCGCGGIAYVGVFNHPTSHAYYQPAFAFQANLGGSNASGKTLAEAASHEAGHNLGLFHDGTSTSAYYLGHGAWAPIMGAGYYRPITQWSRGEYANANNPEDDLARMTVYGAPVRADDHGDTAATATAIGSAATGRIETGTDVDAFSFTLTEARFTTLQAMPAPAGPNLDLRLSLLDSGGAPLLESDPPSAMVSGDTASGLGATLEATLPAGSYVVVVEGVGAGSVLGSGYSDYGSLGTYELVVTQVAPTCVAAPPGIIGWWKGEGSLAAAAGPSLTGSAAFGPSIVGQGMVLTGPAGLPAAGFPSVTDEVTVEAWIKPEATGFAQALFSRLRWVGAEDDSSFALFLTEAHLLWVIEEPSLRERPSVSAPASMLYDGAFHHVAATWSDDMVLYIDGAAVATAPARGQISPALATELIVGGTTPGPGHGLPFAGVIDEPTVYDRALAASEIQSIHTAGAGGKCSS